MQPDNPSLVPGIHMVQEESQLPQVVPLPSVKGCGMCTHTRDRGGRGRERGEICIINNI